MKPKTLARLLLPSVILVLSLSACTDPNEEFIQGRWVFANEHNIERSGPAHVLYEWVFSGGTFFTQTTVAEPQTLYGNYRIIKSEEGLLRIEIYNLNGTRAYAYTDQKGELDIQIDTENDQIRIQGELFYREKP